MTARSAATALFLLLASGPASGASGPRASALRLAPTLSSSAGVNAAAGVSTREHSNHNVGSTHQPQPTQPRNKSGAGGKQASGQAKLTLLCHRGRRGRNLHEDGGRHNGGFSVLSGRAGEGVCAEWVGALGHPKASENSELFLSFSRVCDVIDLTLPQQRFDSLEPRLRILGLSISIALLALGNLALSLALGIVVARVRVLRLRESNSTRKNRSATNAPPGRRRRRRPQEAGN